MSAIIGLDFGGCNTEIYVKGKGIVLREPSVAAVDPEGNVVAVGVEALLIRGRAPGSVTIRRPIRDSAISDFNLTAEMLDRFLEAAAKGGKRVLVAAKCGIGGENRELIRSALADCRVKHIDFVDSPLAALRGALQGDLSEGSAINGGNFNPHADGVLLCDIGAGSVETAYIRQGEILRSETYFGGGRDADKTICTYLRRRHGFAVTKISAQAAKHKLDLRNPDAEPIELRGLDVSTGLPRKMKIPTVELIRCAAPQIKGAYDCIAAVLANLPRYAGKEATVEKIILVGGGALLPGIDDYISELTGRDVVLAENPLDCAVRGLGAMIEEKQVR